MKTSYFNRPAVIRWTALTVCLSFMCACSGGDKSAADETSDKPKNHIFSVPMKALDKAKGLEKTLQDDADERSKQIDKQTEQ